MKTKDQGLYMQQANRKWKPRAEITPLVWWKPVTLNENLGPNIHTTSSAYTPLWDENLKPQGIYRLKFWTTAMGWKPISKEDPRYETGMNFRDELVFLEGPAYGIYPSAPDRDIIYIYIIYIYILHILYMCLWLFVHVFVRESMHIQSYTYMQTYWQYKNSSCV